MCIEVATVRSGGMNAYRCDRCGKYYGDNKRIKTKGAVHGDYIVGISTICRHGKDENFDLCDDCIEALNNFLQGVNEEVKNHDGCQGCKHMEKEADELPCVVCMNRYRNRWEAREDGAEDER